MIAPVDVELREVTKRFGETTALDDLSFTVPAGRFVTLLGPSGCGKTTLLRLVAGFIMPDAGDVLLGGEVITHVPSNRRQVGMVFQNYALFPHMTVERNVSFGLRMRHAPADLVARRTDEMLALVGLQELRHRYPHQLSGGQQQRVALARALAIQPRVLLLDEPFGALDRKLRLQMQVDVKKIIRQLGITTVFVTHDQEEALTMSDLIAVMSAGRIVQSGGPTEIYDNPRDPFVADFVGGSNFIPVEVVEVTPGAVRLRHPGVTFLVPLAGDLRPGQRATLVVRPENLRLGSAGEPGGLPGAVSFVRPIGPLLEYEVEATSGVRLKITAVRSPDARTFALGEAVGVVLADPQACTVFAT
ncbi:MAG: ABC transporter ATP-binding protein [Armatimonadota bacterium]|nr:ABC transporter ATP-binding protein [Armatimonadota bacterium]MDR7485924.1 ABC transporter ATP-binding protein [Armatimonadota bacterium]MDR7533125.1 ABC transporter ATP-binding protein [Armatimonadota bacterium]MDR7536629.1 ABC transporter ATP-binding protein [Armatimonadota bacterium]